MPLQSSAGNVSGRVYRFAGSTFTSKVNFSPSEGADRVREGNIETWRIKTSGTLELDPTIPTSGPTAFQISTITVGGGGGSGSLNYYFVSPSYPSLSPRQLQCSGAGGGGGVSPLQTIQVDSNSFPVVVGAGGGGSATGSSSRVGPPANPAYDTTVAGGGTAGQRVPPWTPPIPVTPIASATGYWTGGTGGGAARFWYTPPFPVTTFGTSYNGPAGPAPADPEHGGPGSNGRVLSQYLLPTPFGSFWVSVAAAFAGSGGGSGPQNPPAFLSTATTGNTPSTRQKDGEGTSITFGNWTVKYGGGGGGGMRQRSPLTNLPSYLPLRDTVDEQIETGGGGFPEYRASTYATSNFAKGRINTGGGAGGRTGDGVYYTPPIGFPSTTRSSINLGLSGGSGVVFISYDVSQIP